MDGKQSLQAHLRVVLNADQRADCYRYCGCSRECAEEAGAVVEYLGVMIASKRFEDSAAFLAPILP